jgi:serine-type D-Ala-D-Ala carboxypeptidase/endopeptidase (penicillin-binding protein 4)
MKKIVALALLLVALPAWAGKSHKAAVKPAPKNLAKPSKTTKSASACKTAAAKEAPRPVLANEAPKPSPNDPDHDRIAHLQEALDGIVHGQVFGRLRVGMRVEDLSSGRVLYGWRSGALMDPASNQKVLATTTALLRLGNTYRYRTEVTGSHPDSAGRIAGDVVLRGSGDPSLRARHIEALAEELAEQGVSSIGGAVLADPRRIGSDEVNPAGRSPLRVGSTSIDVHVRPGHKVGERPIVSVRPASDAFIVVNQAETRAKGKGRLDVHFERAGGRYEVVVSGRISIARGEVVLHRAPPNPPLYAAILLRHALVQAGVAVHGGAGLYNAEARSRVASTGLDGALMAMTAQTSDSPVPLAAREPPVTTELLAVHESDALPILLRRVNKDSDNEWAERVLETVGAEVLGGAATPAKGVRILREALSDLGLSATAYVPTNGSGLGHQNRVTAAGMAELLRRLYFDPRLGPELMQSLSVGGVDGTTRNRFRGSLAAHRVRAKTGTLSGVSCLSGFVGDGSDILAFSILVEGHRRRSVKLVRATQVSAVNAMMRFARRAAGPLPDEASMPEGDFETGEEADDNPSHEDETADQTADEPASEK